MNFEGNAGFAVLAADRLLGESVYCTTDNSSISSTDFESAFASLHPTSTRTNTESNDESENFYGMGEDFVLSLLLSSMLADLKYGLP